MIKVIGNNLDFSADTPKPFILIQTQDSKSPFSHFLSYNKHSEKIFISSVTSPHKGRKFKGFQYEDQIVFKNPICQLLLNVKLIQTTFTHQK